MGTAGNMGIEENLAMAYRRAAAGPARCVGVILAMRTLNFTKKSCRCLTLGLEGRLHQQGPAFWG